MTLTNTTPTATNAQFNVSAGATISGTLSGADADGDAIRYSIVQQPSVGTLTLDTTTGAFQYASSASGAGAVTVTFAVTDGASTSQGTLQFQYQAVTSPPPTNGGGGKSGGGGSSDALLLALLASLGAIARVRRRQSIAA